MLATNSFRHLLIGLVVGVFFGMITGIFAGVTQSVILIYWIVPVQLFIFLVVYNLVEQT
jgi:ABC-type dipeptide/oligopeptide/nickel transport system permease subunit